MENTNKLNYCAFTLSVEEHMKRDHNIFVSWVSFCYLIFKNFSKIFFCNIFWFPLFMTKFMCYKFFQISYNYLKLSVLQKIQKYIFSLRGILHFCQNVFKTETWPILLCTKTEISPKLKSHQTVMYPKIKCHQYSNTTKTEISPQLKCNQN